VDAGGGNGSAARGYPGVMGSRGDVTTTIKYTKVPWDLFKDPPKLN